MNLTQEQLIKIKEHARLFYSPAKIAAAMGLDVKQFKLEVKDEESDAYAAYYGGQLESEAELWISILKSAKAGSSPAQTMAVQKLQTCRMEERK